MYTLYHSFVGESKGHTSTTRKLQMVIVHPSEWLEHAQYFKLDYCLPASLQDILKNVSFEIPVYLQQQNGLFEFNQYCSSKDNNFCISFNALCRLLYLFDSPSWEKRKEHLYMKATEDLNQPSFQQLCPYFRRLVSSQRTCGTFSCTELIDAPSSDVTLMLRVEARLDKGATQPSITAWLQYFKTNTGDENSNNNNNYNPNENPISYAYDVSLFRLEELVLNLKTHLLKEQDIAQRANASLDLVTQAMQENEMYPIHFAESLPPQQHYHSSTLSTQQQQQQLLLNLQPTTSKSSSLSSNPKKRHNASSFKSRDHKSSSKKTNNSCN